MSEPLLAELATDIAEHGLLEPITVDSSGRIVDGRNRFLACRKAGVSCFGVRFDGDERRLVEFSISKNVRRRHLTESQRAMLAAHVANLGDGVRADRVGRSIDRPTPITNQNAADMLNVGETTVLRGRRILREGAPELVHAVESGEVSVNAALGLIDLDHDQQREYLPHIKKANPMGASRKPKQSAAPNQRR